MEASLSKRCTNLLFRPVRGLRFSFKPDMFLARLIDLYSLVVLGAVILSWTQLSPYHPIAKLIHSLTEPVLAPIRKAIPTMGGLDFSPMLLLVGLQVLRNIVV